MSIYSSTISKGVKFKEWSAKNAPTFAQLFKFFRLKAGFETLTQFAKALANEGYIYDNSLFSHWQRGSRVPKNRKLILAVIRVFNKNGLWLGRDGADLILQSVGKKSLEIEELESKILSFEANLKSNQKNDWKNEENWQIELQKFISDNLTSKKLNKNIDRKNEMRRFNFILSSKSYLYFEKASKENYSSKAEFLRMLLEDYRRTN